MFCGVLVLSELSDRRDQQQNERSQPGGHTERSLRRGLPAALGESEQAHRARQREPAEAAQNESGSEDPEYAGIADEEEYGDRHRRRGIPVERRPDGRDEVVAADVQLRVDVAAGREADRQREGL